MLTLYDGSRERGQLQEEATSSERRFGRVRELVEECLLDCSYTPKQRLGMVLAWIAASQRCESVNTFSTGADHLSASTSSSHPSPRSGQMMPHPSQHQHPPLLCSLMPQRFHLLVPTFFRASTARTLEPLSPWTMVIAGRTRDEDKISERRAGIVGEYTASTSPTGLAYHSPHPPSE